MNIPEKETWENELPSYLVHDIDAYIQGLKENSSLLDCYYDELYGSINIAYCSDNCITYEQAVYLRQKYLGYE